MRYKNDCFSVRLKSNLIDFLRWKLKKIEYYNAIFRLSFCGIIWEINNMKKKSWWNFWYFKEYLFSWLQKCYWNVYYFTKEIKKKIRKLMFSDVNLCYRLCSN